MLLIYSRGSPAIVYYQPRPPALQERHNMSHSLNARKSSLSKDLGMYDFGAGSSYS